MSNRRAPLLPPGPPGYPNTPSHQLRGAVMKMLDHFTSLVTLISLFVLGPALGGAIFRRAHGPITQAVCTLVGISLLLGLYGLIWTARPRLVAWYSWLHDIPIEIVGSVDISGHVSSDIQEPLRVQIER